jgi:aryl-alcohol dehydrogenase-like predicted oxidoreductase
MRLKKVLIHVSQMAAWEFQTLQTIAKEHGWHQFISMQNYHNLLYREEEREMMPYCFDTGVGLIPWSPLARGILTRPWKSSASTRERSDKFLKSIILDRESESDAKTVRRVEEVAGKKGVSMSAVAMAWSLKKGVNPIIGLNSKERIDEACENLKVELTEEEVNYLEEAYVPKSITGY